MDAEHLRDALVALDAVEGNLHGLTLDDGYRSARERVEALRFYFNRRLERVEREAMAKFSAQPGGTVSNAA